MPIEKTLENPEITSVIELQAYKNLAENIPQLVWLTRPDGFVEYFNQRWFDYTGLSAKETLGEGWKQVIHPEDLSRVLEGWNQALKTTDSLEIQCRFKSAAGEYRWFFCRGVPLRNRDGSVANWFGASTDIHDQKETEERLHSKVKELTDSEERVLEEKKRLERTNLELDSFVYIASHDLRAPLRGISSFASMLIEEYSDKLDAEGKDYLNEIKKGAQKMGILIKDLLTLSRISRINNPYQNVDMNQLIASVLDRLGNEIKLFKATVTVQPNLPNMVCDPIKIKEIFANLIGNAIKFYPKKKGDRHVEVGGEDKDSSWVFYVKDRGIGIEPEYHERIFEMFSRLNSEQAFEGTGTGLYIVKRIVEDHKGKIWLDSAKGKGTTFYFTLPKDLEKTQTY